MVHFNLAPPVPRRRSAIKVLESSIDDPSTNASYQDRDMESFEIFSNEPNLSTKQRRGSYRGIYPEMPRAKPMPAPRHHISRSAGNLADANDEAIVNPRSYHRGLLRVVSSTNVSPSKIPRRTSSGATGTLRSSSSSSSLRRDSLTANQIDSSFRNRTHSASPRRRSSVDVNGSMIDLGVTPTRSSNRISKPTTLSPIVGTPNKDSTPEDESNSSSSPTKIPVRRNSNVNIHNRVASRSNSRSGSRAPSPPKAPSRPSPSKIPHKVSARTSPTKGAKAATPNSERKLKPTTRNATKETSSAQKEPGISRQSSSVKKPPPSTLKREPSTLKRTPSNLKRELSNRSLKREQSQINLTGATTARRTLAGAATTVALLKNQSDSSLAKRLEKKNSFKQARRTSSESDGLNEIDTANTSDNLIPLTATNMTGPISTAVIASQPVQITAAVTSQLNKTNSSGQIVSSINANPSTDNVTSEISAKSKETPSKKTAAGDEAAARGTPAKAAAGAAGEAMMSATAQPSPAATAAAAPAVAPLEKVASTKSLGTKSLAESAMVSAAMQNAAEAEVEPVASAIETNVNVIEPDDAATSDSNPDTAHHSAMMLHPDDHVRAPASDAEMRTAAAAKPAKISGQSPNGDAMPNERSEAIMGQM